MTYNTENAKEVTANTQLPAENILDGCIISIKDGQVKDFVKNLEKWEGKPEQSAINCLIQVTVPGKEEKVEIEQIFTYNNNEDGILTYTPNSNIGKFKRKYDSLPKPGTPCKIVTNEDGFGKVKLV